MKKKLFVVVFVLSLYSFFVAVFALADSQGLIAKALDETGLNNDATPTIQRFIDPFPEPPRPNQWVATNFIDPFPEPPRPDQVLAQDFIDPFPEPPRPDQLMATNFIDPFPEPPRP